MVKLAGYEADRATYGQASGAGGIIFRISATTGCSVLFNSNVAAIGTETKAVGIGFLRGIEAGAGAIPPAMHSASTALSPTRGGRTDDSGQTRPQAWGRFLRGDSGIFHLISSISSNTQQTTQYENP